MLFRTLVRRRAVAAILSFGAMHAPTVAQDAFVAIPAEKAASYHFDFARNFFPTPEAEKTARVDLYDKLKELEKLKGNVAASADNLLRAIDLNNEVQIRFNRLYSYLYLRNAVNTRDEGSLADSSALDAEISSRTAFLRQEALRIDDLTFKAFAKRKPALKVYLPAITAIGRDRPYTLSLKEEELLSATAPNNDWAYDLYEKLRAAKQIDVFQRDLYAFAHLRLAEARTRLARLHHFPDAASEAYLKSYWTKADVDALIEKITAASGLYNRYQQMRADRARKAVAEKEKLEILRFTIDQASEAIRNALAPLGQTYGRELAALLDPSNGRMDIVPGNDRKRGGFSQGFIGTDSVFFSGGFAGSYNDVRVLTHESTHAVHRQLMNRGHVLPVYATGPHYLFEAFAIFNEFLLPDYLYDHESDPLRKQYYLQQFLDGKGTAMFYVAPEVALEHALYAALDGKKITSADDLDALTKRIYAPFSISPERNEQQKSQWMNLGLMYEDPFYYANYVYGAMLALNFYRMYTRDREHFILRYIALMQNGFDAPPEVLLKRFLDLDLDDPKLVSDAIEVVRGKIDLLEKSYGK